jgi:hypothetical protein
MEQPKIEKIIYWNLGIYIGYTLLGALNMEKIHTARGVDLLIRISFSIFSLIIHAITNFILAFRNFRNNKKRIWKTISFNWVSCFANRISSMHYVIILV